MLKKELKVTASSIYKYFFYTQLTFVEHVPKDFYIVCDCVVAFYLFLLYKMYEIFHNIFFAASFFVFCNN